MSFSAVCEQVEIFTVNVECRHLEKEFHDAISPYNALNVNIKSPSSTMEQVLIQNPNFQVDRANYATFTVPPLSTIFNIFIISDDNEAH